MSFDMVVSRVLEVGAVFAVFACGVGILALSAMIFDTIRRGD